MPLGENAKIHNMFIVQGDEETRHRQDMISGNKPEAYKSTLGNQIPNVNESDASMNSRMRGSIVGQK